MSQPSSSGSTGTSAPTPPDYVDPDFDPDTVEEHTRAFSALGNETRYMVARLLYNAADEMCVCHIEPILDVNQSTTSRALKVLYDAGLVTRRKDGRWRYYSTTPLGEALLEGIETVDD